MTTIAYCGIDATNLWYTLDCGLLPLVGPKRTVGKNIRYADPPTNPSDLAWLAGLLDGEGCFADWGAYPSQSGLRRHYPTIALAMTDSDVVERAANYFGSKVHCNAARPPATKPTYRTTVNGAKAGKFMLALLPYMGQRRSAKINSVLMRWIGQQL